MVESFKKTTRCLDIFLQKRTTIKINIKDIKGSTRKLGSNSQPERNFTLLLL